jgi:sporulation protein YlmC with PRC-barrel domain
MRLSIPGRARNAAADTRFTQLAQLRARREQRAGEKVAARALEGSLISLTALIGSKVMDSDGRAVGRLRDIVVRWTAHESHPRVTAIIVRSGKRDALIGARWIEVSAPSSVRLRAAKAYARAVERHSGDVALAHDVLDRQVVDSGGIQIVRPSDIYLATVYGAVELVGIEVGIGALLRRLGPRRLRGRIRPERVIDWGSLASFAPSPVDAAEHHGRRSEIAGDAGAGLALAMSAGEVKRLRPSEAEAALRAAQAGSKGGSS